MMAQQRIDHGDGVLHPVHSDLRIDRRVEVGGEIFVAVESLARHRDEDTKRGVDYRRFVERPTCVRGKRKYPTTGYDCPHE
jgi:hypothetical protein